MGQKIHPEGFRVGYIHDWKSNWFDERNFAGGSFVTPAMFGSYRYGSPLLNVSFDPDVGHERGRAEQRAAPRRRHPGPVQRDHQR